MTTSFGERELSRLRRSNLNAAEHVEAFANHRRHLTGLLMAGGVEPEARAGDLRLCVLGAGNAGDLDLERLAEKYHSIHLVDMDEEALARAYERQTARTRARLVTHGAMDLSGMLERLEPWRDMQVTADELLEHPELTSARLAARLGGPFSVVLSACVLSQMQLAVRRALSEEHRLFAAVCYTVTLTHLRTLARLTEPGGRAVLASDAATEEMAPLQAAGAQTDLRQLLAGLVKAGDVFHVVNPNGIIEMLTDDPPLSRELAQPRISDVWLWHNGPRRILLVYALTLQRAMRA